MKNVCVVHTMEFDHTVISRTNNFPMMMLKQYMFLRFVFKILTKFGLKKLLMIIIVYLRFLNLLLNLHI